MKIKFLNNTITVLQSKTVLPYPFYDVNYSYNTIYVSQHLDIDNINIDKEQLNSIILKGCIDICGKNMIGLGQNINPVYEYILSKINILNDVYDIDDNGNKINPFIKNEDTTD